MLKLLVSGLPPSVCRTLVWEGYILCSLVRVCLCFLPLLEAYHYNHSAIFPQEHETQFLIFFSLGLILGAFKFQIYSKIWMNYCCTFFPNINLFIHFHFSYLFLTVIKTVNKFNISAEYYFSKGCGRLHKPMSFWSNWFQFMIETKSSKDYSLF